MRLTEKDYCGYDIKNRNDFNGYDNEEDSQKLFSCLQKLGQLEDIEEELGIDLVTLIKAEKDGIWYNSNGTFYFNYFDVSLAHRCFRRYVDYFRNYMSFDFKDYGKTWALTKEELENERI